MMNQVTRHQVAEGDAAAVPSKCALSGEVSGAAGTVTAKTTTSGAIAVRGCQGRLDLHPGYGAVEVEGAADGIAPDSWAPALLLMLIAAYSAIAVVRLLRGGH